jgi:HEAT repeat protein
VKRQAVKQGHGRSGRVILAAFFLLFLSCSSLEKELNSLNSSDTDTRRKAAISLARRLKGFESPESPHYREIVRALFRTATGDPNSFVRAAALSSLVENAPTDSPETISACLKDSSPLVREEAVKAAGKIKAGFLATTIAKLLIEDPDVSVRRICPPALASFASAQPELPREILDALLSALQDDEDSVRFAARDSLKRITGTDAGESKENWKRLLEERERKK